MGFKLFPAKKIKTYNKIFCIGSNKTGTTSLEKALIDLKYKMGDQRQGELLLEDWIKRDFSKLEQLCLSAEAFQDAPFSFPFTFIYLDQRFKGSKFILTVRSSADEWYNSLISFHGKLWGNGNVPTLQNLKDAMYLYKGYAYKGIKGIYNTPDNDLYNKNRMIEIYDQHNNMVLDYFRFRPNDLLVINLNETDSYKKLCSFLGKEPLYDVFPWMNKTSERV